MRPNRSIVRMLVAAVALWAGAAAAPAQQSITRAQLPPNVARAVTTSAARITRPHAAAVATVVPPGPAPSGDTGASHPIAATVPVIVLQRGQFIAAPIAGPPIAIRRISPDAIRPGAHEHTLFALPERYIGTFLASTGPTDLAYLRPAFLPLGVLQYDTARHLFAGRFEIGLEDSVHPAEPRALSGPFHMQFGGNADSFLPESLDVGHTNLPLQSVTVFARNPLDSVQVRVVTEADVRGTTIWLPIQPALEFGDADARAQGFGLERIPVTVRLLGTAKSAPTLVTLNAPGATVEPSTLLVGAGLAPTAYLRTKAVGIVMLEASATGLETIHMPVDFTFPFLFLTAALLGGAAGAGYKTMRQPSARRRSPVRALLTGMLGGVIAAVVYYAIGVSLLAVQVDVHYFSEAAVFSLAALAGLFGIGLQGKKGGSGS